MEDSQVITSVTAVVPAGQEEVFLAGYRALLAQDKPEGLLRSELLRGEGGRWLLQTLWRDRAAIIASRSPGAPAPALALFEQIGAQPAHELLHVQERYDAVEDQATSS